MVNVHILPDVHTGPGGNDRWIFDYNISFLFDDERSFSFSSNSNGGTGIILDQDNRDHSGICIENPFNPQPPLAKFVTNAVLNKVVLEFHTHNDDKHGNTQLNVYLVNRLGATTSQDIAIGLDLLKGETFSDPSYIKVVFSSTDLPLASYSIRLEDIVLPVVNINIAPAGDDRWIFDYRVTYVFTNGQSFSSKTSGIILDQDNHKHTGVYRGDSLPTQTPPGLACLKGPSVDHVTNPKKISLAFLEKKLSEFINNRQGLGSEYPPLKRIRIHNTGVFGTTSPASYYDIQSIDAAPLTPGAILPAGYEEAVKYDSSPTDLGQETGAAATVRLYFNDINSNAFTANVNGQEDPPITIEIDFETVGPPEVSGNFGTIDFSKFYVKLGLTLTLDPITNSIDVMSWLTDLAKNIHFTAIPGSPLFLVSGSFLGQPIQETKVLPADYITQLKDQVVQVSLQSVQEGVTTAAIRTNIRDKIFTTLTDKDPFDGTTVRERVNAFVNSWLLGGTIEGSNRCKVQGRTISADELDISYSGPASTFEFMEAPGWPPGNFTPDTLANIDHIVVLTMENRSFDHMLGYLSLPIEKGGRGRTDVDGLKGNEVNTYKGVPYPSFAFAPGDTVFSPDPPHSYEPVARAINGGKMDGFVASYSEERGPTVGPRIMGYHTAANVPIYDAMARDFAVGQRWFAPHPGPTFCNRFYELTGRLNIDPLGRWEFSNSSPLRPVFTRTIFDWLSDRGISWKYLESGYCFLRFFEQHTFNTENVATFDDPLFGFAKLAQTGNLPSVTFIDPHFIELPPGGNCDGPPADIRQGQLLVQQVVEAVVSGANWDKTPLIVTYDEHGGFYDHVAPPPAAKVSPESLETYGVRVPAFIVSPWVKGGTVFGKDGDTQTPSNGPGQSLHFDHTSILKTIVRRFMSNTSPNQSLPYLGPRFAAAHDLSSVIDAEMRPGPFRPFIPYNLTYIASKMCLDLQYGNATPGTILWQYDPNNTPAQQFRLEDAGNGYFYIRTYTGDTYVTIDVPANVVKGQPFGVKEELKYLSGTATQNPDYQRWQFTNHSATVMNRDQFNITNAAFNELVLQPSGDSLLSGAAVVLAPASKTTILFTNSNPWLVTSPLLPSDGEVLNGSQ